MKNNPLTIGWLYPDLMSTYGDRGNVMILKSRAKWAGVQVAVKNIYLETPGKQLLDVDLLFMGGAQDRQQEIVNLDLIQNKKGYLKEAIEKGIPGLFVCGAYQFLGNYYITAEGSLIEGLKIFDIYTENPGGKEKRLIGDIVIESKLINGKNIVGFENHGGRTFLSKKMEPFAKVTYGKGNNGMDGTEGVIYKNTIGTYLHGPILSKSPALADWLIKQALNIKGLPHKPQKIDDRIEAIASEMQIKKMAQSKRFSFLKNQVFLRA